MNGWRGIRPTCGDSLKKQYGTKWRITSGWRKTKCCGRNGGGRGSPIRGFPGGDRNSNFLFISAKHDGGVGAGDGGAAPQALGQKQIQVVGAAAAHFDQVVVLSGHVVALGDFFEVVDAFEKSFRVVGFLEGHPDEGGESIAGPGVVD